MSAERRITDKVTRILPEELSYEEARDILQDHDNRKRRELAQRPDTPPEMLYYLANDAADEVRANVAQNPSTPSQANDRLTKDPDEEVRCALARKIPRLIPELSHEEQNVLQKRTLATLEKLAQDQSPRVRQIVAKEIKACSTIPQRLVKKLAQDTELIVCAPVLEYSPLLPEFDLLEIIASSQVEGALEAVARRETVSEEVSGALAATLDIPAVAALLANQNAQIRSKTLDEITRNARDIEEWHGSLVMRPELSARAIRRVATFVSHSLLETLAERQDLDPRTAARLQRQMRKRVEREPSWQASDEDMKAATRARNAREQNALDEDRLIGAADAGDRFFLIHALALMTGFDPVLVRRAFAMKNGKLITALTWKAGLSMRLSLKLQTAIAHVPPESRVCARDGLDYPLNDKELSLYLDYLANTDITD